MWPKPNSAKSCHGTTGRRRRAAWNRAVRSAAAYQNGKNAKSLRSRECARRARPRATVIAAAGANCARAHDQPGCTGLSHDRRATGAGRLPRRRGRDAQLSYWSRGPLAQVRASRGPQQPCGIARPGPRALRSRRGKQNKHWPASPIRFSVSAACIRAATALARLLLATSRPRRTRPGCQRAERSWLRRGRHAERLRQARHRWPTRAHLAEHLAGGVHLPARVRIGCRGLLRAEVIVAPALTFGDRVAWRGARLTADRAEWLDRGAPACACGRRGASAGQEQRPPSARKAPGLW
jgi:hypothetical protein